MPLLFLKRIWKTKNTGFGIGGNDSGMINKWICLSGATSVLIGFKGNDLVIISKWKICLGK